MHSSDSKPHTLKLNIESLHVAPTDENALAIVMFLRHEQRHHQVERRTDETKDDLAIANKTHTATTDLALKYMNARLDSELSARFADYRVAKEAFDLSLKDGNNDLATKIRKENFRKDEFGQLLFKQEIKLGRPLTEEEVLKDFRAPMLHASNDHYLKKFAEDAAQTAPSLDPAQ